MRWTEAVKESAKRILSVIPPQMRQRRKYQKIKQFLAAAQWWSPLEIEKWQLLKVREMVSYAYNSVPGYRELYNSVGIAPEDISKMEDIRSLPFVTKEMLRDNIKDFTSCLIPASRLRYATTSGSTGIPFGFYLTSLNSSMESAFMHSGWERADWKSGDCCAVLRGAFVGTENRFWRYDSYRRELLLSSYYLTEKTYGKYEEKILEYCPRHLQAYPSALTILSDLALASGRISEVFEVLFLGSENLYSWQKDKIARAFPKSRIFGWYGHAEQTVLAAMCEYSDQYHVWPFYGLTEILDEQGNPVKAGETGEIVGTSFWNFGTPFIRYRTMDIALKGGARCDACKRNFQLIERIDGRLQEIIVSRTGRFITMTAINMHDNIFDSLKQFQFYQDEPGKLLFRYVPKAYLLVDDVERIREGLLTKLGEDVTLELKQVDEIGKTRSGKYRFLEQKLCLQYGDR